MRFIYTHVIAKVRAAAVAAMIILVLPILNLGLGLIGLGPLTPAAVEHMGVIAQSIVYYVQELYWIIAAAIPVIVAYFQPPDGADAPVQVTPPSAGNAAVA